MYFIPAMTLNFQQPLLQSSNFSGSLDSERSKQNHLFKKHFFFYINVKVFTDTRDEFNASSLYKSIYLLYYIILLA